MKSLKNSKFDFCKFSETHFAHIPTFGGWNWPSVPKARFLLDAFTILMLSWFDAHDIGAQCVEDSVKLVGELSQNEGYVLICLEGAWGKIQYGNSAAATVVCRQLGFLTTESYYYNFQLNFRY